MNEVLKKSVQPSFSDLFQKIDPAIIVQSSETDLTSTNLGLVMRRIAYGENQFREFLQSGKKTDRYDGSYYLEAGIFGIVDGNDGRAMRTIIQAFAKEAGYNEELDHPDTHPTIQLVQRGKTAVTFYHALDIEQIHQINGDVWQLMLCKRI